MNTRKTRLNILLLTSLAFLSSATLASASHTNTLLQEISDVVERAHVSGGATVVESHASASTGGQSISNGTSITTGNSTASASIKTTIDANSETGGTATVETVIEENGVTTTVHEERSFIPGEAVNIRVSVPEKTQTAKAPVGIGAHASTSQTDVSTDTEAPNTHLGIPASTEKEMGLIENVTNRIFLFVTRILSFFTHW